MVSAFLWGYTLHAVALMMVHLFCTGTKLFLHQLASVFAAATFRHLADRHPIRQMLNPHLVGAISSWKWIRDHVLNPGGMADQVRRPLLLSFVMPKVVIDPLAVHLLWFASSYSLRFQQNWCLLMQSLQEQRHAGRPA